MELYIFKGVHIWNFLCYNLLIQNCGFFKLKKIPMSHLWSKQSILGMLIRVQRNFGVVHKQPNKILLLATPRVRRGGGGVFFFPFFGGGVLISQFIFQIEIAIEGFSNTFDTSTIYVRNVASKKCNCNHLLCPPPTPHDYSFYSKSQPRTSII